MDEYLPGFVFNVDETGHVIVLRHYATSRKVVGSNPNKAVDFFSLPNPSSCTIALGFIQPLTEMSIRKYFWG
jgi:hypothetical protein